MAGRITDLFLWIRVHFAQWLQNIKQAASYNFWMNILLALQQKNVFPLQTEG